MAKLHQISEVATPVQVEPYVRILGIDGAIEFLLEFGGAELYFSPNPNPKNHLARLVGREKATALAKASEGMPRRIPTAKPWIANVKKSKGLTVAEIARTLHCTDVTVRRWLKPNSASSQKHGPQLNLF